MQITDIFEVFKNLQHIFLFILKQKKIEDNEKNNLILNLKVGMCILQSGPSRASRGPGVEIATAPGGWTKKSHVAITL